ncbi:hypothetical protein J3R82DRAFT_630 [Butyriboletus roseoflavus]|nr:hypothetical protein J3R82DRAFT_630 [Butyriboletus roseoflavus]
MPTTESTFDEIKINFIGLCHKIIAQPVATHEPEFVIDVGVNLTDPVFRGIYRGKRKHEGMSIGSNGSSQDSNNTKTDSSEDDLDVMLERSRLAGVKSMIITGSSLHESELALNLAHQKGWCPVCLLCLASCPTREQGSMQPEFDQHPGGPDAYLLALDKFVGDNLRPSGRVVAIGECGLGGHSIFSRRRTGVIHFLQIMIEPILHPKKSSKGIFVSVKR